MRSDFFIAQKARKGRAEEMRLTQMSPVIKTAGIMALLCAVAQVALAIGLFLAFRASIV